MSAPETDGRTEIYEKLEHGLSLTNLINPESLGNLLERFHRYLGLGLVALDAEGKRLGEARDPIALCPPGQAAGCPACKGELPAFEGEDKFQVSACVSGARFIR